MVGDERQSTTSLGFGAFGGTTRLKLKVTVRHLLLLFYRELCPKGGTPQHGISVRFDT